MTRSPRRSVAADLQALLDAITASPIIFWRRRAPVKPSGDWASVRKSGEVDAYVLAWIASHVRDSRRSHRILM